MAAENEELARVVATMQQSHSQLATELAAWAAQYPPQAVRVAEKVLCC